ncbi:DMT family transporter [Tistrella sp. 25B02-3]
MSKRIEGYCYLAAAMLLVGSTVVAARLIGAGLAPFTATALRFAIALPVFVVAMAATGARLPALGRRDWAVLAVQAVAGSVGYTVLLIMGTRLTSAADAGVIIGTLPVVAATISVVVLGERPGRRLLVAIALAAAGLAAIAIAGGGQNDGDANGGWNRLAGNALILGAVVCEGLFILLNKRIRTAIQPLALSTIMTGFGLIAAAIPAVFEARPPILDPRSRHRGCLGHGPARRALLRPGAHRRRFRAVVCRRRPGDRQRGRPVHQPCPGFGRGAGGAGSG